MKLVLAMAAALAAGAACRATPPPNPPRDVVVWQEVGAWSGRGNRQTEAFTSDTGGFRVRWETTNETTPGAGRLKVTFRSGDSGRPIIEAVDVRGVGRDEEEVADNVRWYFLTIESAGVDWTVHVDERLRARQSAR
jgi:ABC-type glycerol-3-phosphate transport system substrate-binding protein